jgi:alpha-beta hydrolase superfamily lysophospholipase
VIGRVLRLIGRAVGLIAGAYLAYIAIRGSRLLVSPIVRPFEPDDEGSPGTPADIGLEFEPVRFTTDDGVTLSGWLIPAARETRTAVIVLHGFSGNRLAELPAFVPWLRERHHVLQFDFRGHGESGAGYVTLGSHERRDVAAAVAFMRSRGYGPIALFGVSMGASIGIIAAAELPVAAVVVDSPFAELHHPIGNRMREVGYPLPGLGSRAIVAAAALRTRTRLPDAIRHVAALAPRALLVIAPKEDRLISWRQGLRLYEAAGEPKELLIIEGAGHAEGYAVDPETYRRRVIAFLDRHLG